MRRFGQILREASRSARSQPAASSLTMLMVAGMVLTVMLTTGRTVAAQQSVLSSIDSVGTRLIVVRADDEAGITAGVLDRLATIDGIEWAGAFTNAIDATNTWVPDGARVPVRYAYGSNFEILGVPAMHGLPGAAYASKRALDLFGLVDGTGSITLKSGQPATVAGRMEVPAFLSEFEPLTLIPTPHPAGTEPVNVVLVLARTPALVGPVADAAVSVLAPQDATKITVRTSEALANLRGLIQGQLSDFSRGLVLALLAVTAVLVGTILFGLVMMRRKDFGRRRALGATRALIVGLLLTQTGILALAGATLGVAGASLALLLQGDPFPPAAFTLAVAVLAVSVAVVAAIIPAVIASRREPIRELRVP